MKTRRIIIFSLILLLIIAIVFYCNSVVRPVKSEFALHIFDQVTDLGFVDINTITENNQTNNYIIDVKGSEDYKKYVVSNVELINQKFQNGSVLITNQPYQDIAIELGFPFSISESYDLLNNENYRKEILLRVYYYLDSKPVIHDIYFINGKDGEIDQRELLQKIKNAISDESRMIISDPNKGVKARTSFFENLVGYYKTTLIDEDMNITENALSFYRNVDDINDLYYTVECTMLSNYFIETEQNYLTFISDIDSIDILIDSEDTCLKRYDYFPKSFSNDTLNIMVGSDTEITKWSFYQKGKWDEIKMSPYLIYKCNDASQSKIITVDIKYIDTVGLAKKEVLSVKKTFQLK